jgi:hypothetical protein
MASTKDKRGEGRTPEPPPRPSTLTTLRLYNDQIDAIAQVALARKRAVGSGRADQAGVMRDLLDAIAQGRQVPADLREALAASYPGK